MTKFTALEVEVLKALVSSSDGNGHDFGFIEDARDAVPTKRALGGVVSSLVQKKIIQVYDTENHGSGPFTQFKFIGIDDAENRDAHVAKLTSE